MFPFLDGLLNGANFVGSQSVSISVIWSTAVLLNFRCLYTVFMYIVMPQGTVAVEVRKQGIERAERVNASMPGMCGGMVSVAVKD